MNERNRKQIEPETDDLKFIRDIEAVLDGPVGDILTGDQMSETGVYDILQKLRDRLNSEGEPERNFDLDYE